MVVAVKVLGCGSGGGRCPARGVILVPVSYGVGVDAQGRGHLRTVAGVCTPRPLSPLEAVDPRNWRVLTTAVPEASSTLNSSRPGAGTGPRHRRAWSR
jgi:hypothetical protein